MDLLEGRARGRERMKLVEEFANAKGVRFNILVNQQTLSLHLEAVVALRSLLKKACKFERWPVRQETINYVDTQ